MAKDLQQTASEKTAETSETTNGAAAPTPAKKSRKDIGYASLLKTQKVRLAIITAVFVIMSICMIVGVYTGTLCGFGWDGFAALCPLGALGTMIATKTMVPRAVISLVCMLLFFFILGRAFCAWLCPTTVINKAKGFFRSASKNREIADAKKAEALAISNYELDLKKGCGSKDGCGDCTTCAEKRAKLNSQHYVLGGALLSTAIFGFPVFCLVCPVGLSFATVLVFWRLFADGDMTWAVILIPAMLIIELVVLKKWCTRFCPIAGLMNLTGRFSKTFKPVIDNDKCLETAKGVACGRCAQVCDFDINLRHPDFGERTLADCTRCRNCADACPTKAITFPVFSKEPTETAEFIELESPVMPDGEAAAR